MHSLHASRGQVYWPVYIAFFNEGNNNIGQGMFVEDDSARTRGRLMKADTFENAPMVGTKYTTVSPSFLYEEPTYIGRRLLGQIESRNLSRADVICRTIVGLSGPASPFQASKPWVEQAWKELEREGIV